MPHKLLGKYVWTVAAVVKADVPMIHAYAIQEIKSRAEYDYRILEVIKTMNALS